MSFTYPEIKSEGMEKIQLEVVMDGTQNVHLLNF